jgi:glycosyltransferase involved in cell wall biosynthesis
MALRAPSRAYHSALRSLLQTIKFDVVQAESIEMAQYALAAQQLGAFATLDQWNAEYVLQRRAALADLRQPRKAHGAVYSLIQWQKLARYERAVCNQLDQTYVVSAQDATALKRIGVARTAAVIPNGVDTAYFAPPAVRSTDPNLLLFTGTLDFRPNIDAVVWFVTHVLPLVRREWPQAYLRVVGRAPHPAILRLAEPGVVEVTGAVADIRPHFATAAAYVLPMRIGGGVRLKLLEAFATALPVITTTMGGDGIEGLQAGVHCVLANDAVDFARATLQVLRDRDFAAALARSGRDLARRHYDWQTIVPRLETNWIHHKPTPKAAGHEPV